MFRQLFKGCVKKVYKVENGKWDYRVEQLFKSAKHDHNFTLHTPSSTLSIKELNGNGGTFAAHAAVSERKGKE